MSDILEPQDLEKAHISALLTLDKHFEEHVVYIYVYSWLCVA